MISKKQNELDEIKWYIGQEIEGDPCGSFAYCKKCNKSEENPCEMALNKYKKSKTRKKSAIKQKNAQTIGEYQFRATVVNEKQ